jgi:glycosyl transferase family 87
VSAIVARRRAFALRLNPPLIAIVLMTLVGLAVLVLLFARAVTLTRGDFDAYYAGATALRTGASMYTDALTWREAGYSTMFPGPKPIPNSPYVYPPALAVALLPLSFLSPYTAGLVWLGLIALSILGTAFLFARFILPLPRRYVLSATVCIAALMALFQPVRTVLSTGQIDSILLLLLTASLVALGRRSVWAGVFLAMAVAIKPTLAVLVLFLLWKRAYRSFAAFVAVSSVLVLPWLLVGLDGIRDYIAVAGYWSSPTFGVTPVNQAPYGFFLRLFTVNAFTVPVVDAPLIAKLLQFAVIGLVAVALVLAVRRSAVPMRQLAVEYGLAIIATLLAGTLSEDNHFTYLVLSILGVFGMLMFGPRTRTSAALIAALVLVVVYLSQPGLTALDLANFEFWQGPVRGARVLMTGAHLYGLLALAAIAWVTARRARAS